MAYSIQGHIFDITQANSKGKSIRENKKRKTKKEVMLF